MRMKGGEILIDISYLELGDDAETNLPLSSLQERERKQILSLFKDKNENDEVDLEKYKPVTIRILKSSQIIYCVCNNIADDKTSVFAYFWDTSFDRLLILTLNNDGIYINGR